MTLSVAVAQLAGFVLFSGGSVCFVWMAWAEDWVLPLQLGCATWIGGCMPYLWVSLRNEYLGEGGHLSNTLQVGGMLGWAVGSAFAFHDDLDFGLQVTNGGFLAGSACLLSDALWQARQLLAPAPVARDERASLLADLLAGVFYMLAGGFGGYATQSVELIRFGNVCWLVGSLISGVRPCLALCGKRPGYGSGAPARRTCTKSVELEAGCTTSAV
jgi:hypothetical protein